MGVEYNFFNTDSDTHLIPNISLYYFNFKMMKRLDYGIYFRFNFLKFGFVFGVKKLIKNSKE